MPLTTQVVSLLEFIKKEWKQHYVSYMVLLVTLIGQIITIVAFICPCVSVNKSGDNCTLEVEYVTYFGDSCVQSYNQLYGLGFLFAPAGCLFLIGLLNLCISCRSDHGMPMSLIKSEEEGQSTEKSSSTKVKIKDVIYLFLSPSLWICIALLDGKYYACATTQLPYDVDRYNENNSVSFYKNCEAVAGDDYKHTSNTFNNHRTTSQGFGWIAILGLGVLCPIIYLIGTFCCSESKNEGTYENPCNKSTDEKNKSVLGKKANEDVPENSSLIDSKKNGKEEEKSYKSTEIVEVAQGMEIHQIPTRSGN